MNLGKDPAELAKIEEAKRSFGEYKFKMDAEYEVPEHEQVDFKKKRQQMILLEGSIHKLKLDFNKRIIDLRIRKKQHKTEIENKNERIHQINDKLGLKENLFAPTIDEKIEEPENFFLVSDKEVADYKTELKAREDAAKNKNQGKGRAAKKQEEKDKEA